MVWYKPSTWFKKSETVTHTDYASNPQTTIITGKAAILCDNPGCSLPILESPVMYDITKKEVYHPGDCAMQANILQAFKSKSMVVGNVEAISLEDAIILFEDHKLKQALPASK